MLSNLGGEERGKGGSKRERVGVGYGGKGGAAGRK